MLSEKFTADNRISDNRDSTLYVFDDAEFKKNNFMPKKNFAYVLYFANLTVKFVFKALCYSIK